MRKINRASIFKKNYKRVKASPIHSKDLDTLLVEVLRFLVADAPLPDNYRDHALVGDWVNHREWHIKPDLLLLYQLEGVNILKLVRLGSHSEIFR